MIINVVLGDGVSIDARVPTEEGNQMIADNNIVNQSSLRLISI
jgi:hypothetical protein